MRTRTDPSRAAPREMRATPENLLALGDRLEDGAVVERVIDDPRHGVCLLQMYESRERLDDDGCALEPAA